MSVNDVFIRKNSEYLDISGNKEGSLIIGDGVIGYKSREITGAIKMLKTGETLFRPNVIVNADINTNAAIDISKTTLQPGERMKWS